MTMIYTTLNIIMSAFSTAVAVPKKMIPMSKVMGVESFKEIKPEMVNLKPIAHGNTVYKTGGVNKISFRIPSFSNALLDTSRSFISVIAAGYTGESPNAPDFDAKAVPADRMGLGLVTGAPVFTRIVIKSSAGLTLEDIDQLDVLDQLFELQEDTSNTSHSFLYGKSLGVQTLTSVGGRCMSHKESYARNFMCALGSTMTPDGLIPQRSTTILTDNQYPNKGAPVGIELLYRFNCGILSKRLAKYLPLFMADGGAGYTFDMDLYVNNGRAIEQHGMDLSKHTSKKELWLHSPQYNMCLLRMDEGLARRFNQIATSGAEVRIPFTTYHTHLASVDQKNMTINIHENATNFKKIWTCLTSLADNDCYNFRGGVYDKLAKVIQYNYRLGTTFVYNEPVQEVYSNYKTIQHVKNSLGVADNYTMLSESPMGFSHANFALQAADPDHRDFIPFCTLHEKGGFHMVANFDYSPEERLMIQGVSSSNPVELNLKLLAQPTNLMAVNFAELCYDLVFKSGIVTYEEQKPGSQSVY